MKHEAEHIIEFECDNKDINIPYIINPMYIYKQGDTFNFINAVDEEVPIRTFEVQNVKHEIRGIIGGEQVIIVYVTEITVQ